MHLPIARRGLAAAALSLVVPLACAQAPASSKPEEKKEDPQKLEKIEVQGSDEVEERRESTAAKIVVNRDELLKHGDANLLDVMKRLPGVTVSGAGGRGASIRMRGLGAGYTQILVNGEPMPPGFSLEQVSPELIERIEIVRGATAQFSTQAIAGTINIVMRRAVTQRQRDVKVGGNLRNGRPSANASIQLSDRVGALSFTIPAVAYGFRFRNENFNETEIADPAGRVVSHYLTHNPGQGEGWGFNMAPRLNWRFARDHTLLNETFVNYHHFQGDFHDRVTTLVAPGPQHPLIDILTESDSTSARTNFTWIRPVGADGKLEVKAGASYNTRKSRSTADTYSAPGVRSLVRESEQSGDDSGLTTNGKFLVPVVAGHAMAFGWDLARSTRGEDRVQREVSFTSTPPQDLDESFEARVDRIAVFGQDEWEVSKTFSTYLGLRWEGIRTRSLGSEFERASNRSSVASPIVHGLWKVGGKDQLRASLARTYKAPNTNDLIPRRFFSLNNTATTPDFQGNPGLGPELSWGFDTAYEHYFDGGGVFSVSGLVRRVEDVILREVIEDAGGRFVSRPGNRGSASIRGIELDAKVNLARLHAGAPGVDVRANLARNWSRLDSVPGPDNRLNEQTRLSGTLGADYKLTSLPLTVGGSFTWKSGGPARVSEEQVVWTSVVRTLDLYALWRFTPAVQLRVNAGNLLAQDYLRVDRYADAGGTIRRAELQRGFRGIGALLEVKL